MRTTIRLDDDVYEFASIYALANGFTLSRAISELIRTAQNAPRLDPKLEYSPNGLPLLPKTGRMITSEMVKNIEEEEFDPKRFR